MTGGERTRYYTVRTRRIPPCSDDVLESCSPLAALLMYRLISQADDQGRLPGHARYVKAVCFPMRAGVSERKVAAALAELASAGFIIRYAADPAATLFRSTAGSTSRASGASG